MNYNWDDLRIFLAAARSGSLSAASRTLDSNQPTLSRRINALEKTLGMRLFQRHAQGLTLTEDGQNLLQIAENMDLAASALNRSRDTTSLISGTVRIAAAEGIGVYIISPALVRLLQHYPELNLSLDSAHSSADLIRGEADIAVRAYRPESADLVIRRVRDMEFGLYAAAEYLAQYGSPQNAAELHQHLFIGYGELLKDHAECRWLEALVSPIRYVLRSDNIPNRIGAASSGAGIAVLPHLLIRDTKLVRILPELAPPSRTIWLVVHRDLRDVARIRVVLEFLTEIIEAA